MISAKNVEADSSVKVVYADSIQRGDGIALIVVASLTLAFVVVVPMLMWCWYHCSWVRPRPYGHRRRYVPAELCCMDSVVVVPVSTAEEVKV